MQADYNNDGCLDILSLRGAWMIPERKSLLRNNCDGTFTDVTEASGLARPATSTQAAVWTDVNNDGFVDLFVGNENRVAQLFLNKRDGTFEDVAARAGVDRPGYTKGVSAADVDNDGWPELYVSNFGGATPFSTTTTTARLPTSPGRPESPGPGRGLRPGSSTTTTTAGPTCLPPATSRRSTSRRARISDCRATRRR